MAIFNVPQLEAADVQQIVGALAPPDPDLTARQAEALALLDEIDATTVTPERLTWLILWSQFFAALRGVQAAVVFRSSLVLESIWRFTLESFLHLVAVYEPVLEAGGEVPDDMPQDQVDEVRRRLVAFAAWGLWNDDNHIDWILDRRTLELLFDATDETSPQAEAELEPVWAQRDAIWNLMDTAALDPWIRMMDRRKQDPEQKPIYSFYELLGLERTTIRQRLQELGNAVNFGTYARSSMIVHGSTANHFVAVEEGDVHPNLTDDIDAESAHGHQISIMAGFDLLREMKALLW